MADRCHATSRVLYSTAHVSLARTRDRLGRVLYSTAHVSLARARARLGRTHVAREVAWHLSAM